MSFDLIEMEHFSNVTFKVCKVIYLIGTKEIQFVSISKTFH